MAHSNSNSSFAFFCFMAFLVVSTTMAQSPLSSPSASPPTSHYETVKPPVSAPKASYPSSSSETVNSPPLPPPTSPSVISFAPAGAPGPAFSAAAVLNTFGAFAASLSAAGLYAAVLAIH